MIHKDRVKVIIFDFEVIQYNYKVFSRVYKQMCVCVYVHDMVMFNNMNGLCYE